MARSVVMYEAVAAMLINIEMREPHSEKWRAITGGILVKFGGCKSRACAPKYREDSISSSIEVQGGINEIAAHRRHLLGVFTLFLLERHWSHNSTLFWPSIDQQISRLCHIVKKVRPAVNGGERN